VATRTGVPVLSCHQNRCPRFELTAQTGTPVLVAAQKGTHLLLTAQ
ncbi:unnamed protein product, partial [Staurois parvus]